MKLNIPYKFAFGFILMFSSSSFLHAKAPDITGARLECNGDVKIVAQILEKLPPGSKEIPYGVVLDIDNQRVEAPDGKMFVAYTQDDGEEGESGPWILGIWGPQYIVSTLFEGSTPIRTHIGVPFFNSEFDKLKVTCTLSLPSRT